MLIELATAVGAVLFYDWQLGGGLIAGELVVPPVSPQTFEVWFSGHALLITLMLIATFIDLDEQTIPDWITVPGTVAALIYAAFWPEFRLPEVVNNAGGMGLTYQHLTFHSNSSGPFPTWHHDWRGLATVASILAVWAFALLPTTPFLFRFMWKAFRQRTSRFVCLTVAFMLQPKRTTTCEIRTSNRRSLLPNMLTMGAIYLILCGLASYIFIQPVPIQWDSFFGAILGLGFGGGMVWAIRIVGGYAMDQEAMGFGDVTLMAMIGAFLGWQASLMTFFFAPFAALIIAVAQLISTKRNDIAFGPYLCLAALFLILGWHSIWNWLKFPVFGWGLNLHFFLLGGLVLFGIMLFAIRLFKERFVYGDEEPETDG